MKKQLMIIGIIVIILTVGLSGCNETKETPEINTNNTVNKYNKLILGTWSVHAKSTTDEYEAGTYTFFSNGSFLVDSTKKILGTYEITDEKFILSAENDTGIYEYSFSEKNDTVKLSGEGWILILTKNRL